VLLHADPLRLSQILTNLLTNAVKYSEPGSRIRIVATVDDGSLSLAVKDDGIGIAPELIPRVFEMFAQFNVASGMPDGGLGIGLALVKGLTELHGGTVEARSGGLGLGSEFIVRLPLSATATGTAPVTIDPSSGAPVRKRILIADDNQDAAASLAMLLELAGHEVRCAHLGEAALSVAQLFRPDTALLDIGMPDITGYEVAQRLRQEPWGKDVQLIALTGWGQDRDRRRAFESGFDHHLSKPIDPDRLEHLIRGTAEPG
jgi:CheY-like chemotaxis protein